MTKTKGQIPPILTLYYSKGDLIIKEGDYGISIYEIISGKVGIFVESGNRETSVAVLGPGMIVGEMAMLKHSNSKRTAWAVGDGPVVLGILDSVRLVQEWESQPPKIKKLISNLIQNIEESTRKAADMIGASK